VKYCCKCEEGFYDVMEHAFCDEHQKEYDEWLNEIYIPEGNCPCGSSVWTNGSMQLTDPPTFPEMMVFRCAICHYIQLEYSRSGRCRIKRRLV